MADVGISYWRIAQPPGPFTVGGISDPLESSESSVSTGVLDDNYYAHNFSFLLANGCYGRMGFWENQKPVYSNGAYYLKFGGSAYPRWYLQQMSSLSIHYWSDIVDDPVNGYARYTGQVGLGTGGFFQQGCISSSSISSVSELSGLSSGSSRSTGSSLSSTLSLSSLGVSSSSSSYIKSLISDLPSYISTCRGMDSIANPATGGQAGMAVSGFLDETGLPDDGSIYKGGLTITAANAGVISCTDASRLFSIDKGMISLTMSFPAHVENGIYAPLAGKELSANPDMAIFSANPGDHYISPPGVYAALTPSGIEFTVWSLGTKITLLDNTTDIEPDTDAVLSFAWDRGRRILVDGERKSAIIMVDGIVTASSDEAIGTGDLGGLFSYASELSGSSASSEEWATAPFFIGDMPAGKNGLLNIIIRRIEIYKEPCAIPMAFLSSPGFVRRLYRADSRQAGIQMVSEGTMWVATTVNEPIFGRTISASVNLSNTGVVAHDAGGLEDETYPHAPIGLPPGIEEVRERQ